MPLDSLSSVTRAIKQLIEPRATAAFGATVTVTPFSAQATPDSLANGTVVNVYLFHVVENSHYKNQPPRGGSGPVPIQHVPLSLDLFYVINARVPASEEEIEAALSEQQLLGIVGKIIHDNPVVTDALIPVPPTDPPILGEGNGFDLILRPVAIEEALSFWSSDENRLSRLSLFVEARVILLRPEKPTTASGTVLQLGAFTLAGAGPLLTTSRSELAFIAPGFGLQRVRAEPARVALFETAVPPDVPWNPADEPDPETEQPFLLQNNRLVLVGASLGRRPRFLDVARAGEPFVRIALDEDPLDPDNPEWAISATSSEISLRFHTSVVDANDVLFEDFVPGIYTARVVVEEEPPPRPANQIGPALTPRTSNQIAFAVVPQVKFITPGTLSRYDIRLVGMYLETDFDLNELDLSLAVGKEVLTYVAGTTPGPGEFVVTANNNIQFRRTPVGGEAFPMPINLTINGAQSTPSWITGPAP